MFTRILFFLTLSVNILHESSSYLVVPATSPTRHQLIGGVGVPLNLEYEAITYGWAIKAQYFLPESTADQLKPIRFPDTFANVTGGKNPFFRPAQNTVNQIPFTNWTVFPYGRRKREILVDPLTGHSYESYDGEVNEVGNVELKNDQNLHESDFDDEFFDDGKIPKYENYKLEDDEDLLDTSGTRWLLYDGISRLLTTKGLEGRYCVLRAICEAAEHKFGSHGGLLGQLAHIVFSPSTSDDRIVNRDHYDYIKAEVLGESGEPCGEIFHKCTRSLMDIFSDVFEEHLVRFK